MFQNRACYQLKSCAILHSQSQNISLDNRNK